MTKFYTTRILLMCCLINVNTSLNVTNSTSSIDKKKWNNVAYDENSSSVYAAGTNILKKFDSDLKELENTNTCTGSDQSCNNYNKILLVDTPNNRLVVCGTYLNGSCSFRSLSNIMNVTNADTKITVCTTSQSNTTVAFLGDNDTLYVGNTPDMTWISGLNVQNDSDRLITDGIFSMSLKSDNLFRLWDCKNYTESVNTRVCTSMSFANNDYFASKSVEYINGFRAQGFLYFFKNLARKSDKSDITPFIVRICESDQNYFSSYIEMPFSCSNSTRMRAVTFMVPDENLANALSLTRDEHVIVSVFENPQNSASSLICLSSYTELATMFILNKKNCPLLYVKNQYFNAVSPSTPCPSENLPLNYCGGPKGSSRTNPIGTLTYNSISVVTIDYKITSIVINSNSNVLILGTDTGYLLMTNLDLLKSSNKAKYSILKMIEDDPVENMILTNNSDFLYLKTPNYIKKIKTADCNSFTTCETCANPINPLCGWCTFSGICSRKRDCASSSSMRRWIPSRGSIDDCPLLLVDEIKIETSNITNDLTLLTRNLPAFESNEVKCSFGSSKSESFATLSNSFVFCTIPNNIIQLDEGYKELSFFLKVVTNGVNIFTRKLRIFTCNFFKKCDECQENNMTCQFDLRSYSCIPGSNFNVSKCPKVLSYSVKIPAGQKQNLSFQVQNIENLQFDQVACYISPVNVLLVAVRMGGNSNKFSCSEYQFTTFGKLENFNLSIQFGPDKHFLINSINIEVYNCQVIGKDDCSSCKNYSSTNDNVYNCTWCTNGCEFDKCLDLSMFNAKCPLPSIYKITPLSGPREGRTVITIEGLNLGYNLTQIVVKMPDICSPIPSLYIPSKKYICYTPKYVNGISSVKLSINVSDVGMKTSNETFEYKEVQVSQVIFPLIGPASGGTRLTLRGSNLLMNPQTQIFLNTSNGLTIFAEKSLSNISQAIFLTPPDSATTKLLINQLNIDGFVLNNLNNSFLYKENPSIDLSGPIATYSSGACLLSMDGSNLDITQSPFANFSYCGQIIIVPVTAFNSTKATIKFPTFQLDCTSKQAHVDLAFDGWKKSVEVIVFPDPIFEIKKNDFPFITITSSINTSVFTLRSDNDKTIILSYPGFPKFTMPLTIQSGGRNCKTLTVSDDIICGLQEDSTDQNEIEVWLCDKTYKLPITKVALFPTLQVALGVGLGALVIIFIIITGALLHKYIKNKKKYKSLMAEIDGIEQEVRNEMKKGFARLQTSENEVQVEETGMDVPFNSYKIFAYRVLYSKERDDPVLHTRKRMEKYDKKMLCFTQLLNSKFFLLIFIKVLESKLELSEKSKIGSFLGLYFLDKMDYATQIVTALLEKKIDGLLADGKDLKLMLRSGESIVERIICCWLTLSMYKHIVGESGKALFELFLAIKKQVYSGPVDVCTSESKFTLSERSFLKNYRSDDNIVVVTFNNAENQPTSCKLLACDAASQAKEKVYEKYFGETPFTRRPRLEKFDLYWQKTVDDVVKLEDEDFYVNDGSARIKTLEMYGVVSGSVVMLREREDSDDQNQLQILGNDTVAIVSGSTVLHDINVIADDSRWHLVDQEKKSQGKSKRYFTEMYYPLLQMKVALEEKIHKFFNSILSVKQSLPPNVKYFFDFMDSAARKRGVSDPDVTSIWKRDCFLLRVWVNLIQNPYFLLDIRRSPVVDPNLTVIGQALIDSCSPQEKKLSKDSPTSTLLFAKDHPNYKKLVTKFYDDIQNLPSTSEAQILKIMESNYSRDIDFNVDFNLEMIICKLYDYAEKHKAEIMVSLDEDESAKNLRLIPKFGQLFSLE